VGEDLDDDIHENNDDSPQTEDCLLLDPAQASLYDTVMETYADLLYRWKMLRQHAEMLKSLSQPRSPDKYLMTVSVACPKCNRALRGNACAQCCRVPVRCGLCRLPCRGVAAVCLGCGHGGHAAHLAAWFRTHAICPSGCGCPCLQKRQM
jgi:hypothetical protein